MSSVFDEIFERAKYYLDTRHNDIHIAWAYDLAQRLLDYYPEADADIVLPATLLHDVGWKMVPEEEQLDAFGPNANKEMQRLHEVEGVRIAGEILGSLGYGSEKIKEILSIIDGHDTRKEALSLNDAIVKDADKLWRYSADGIEIDHFRFKIELEAYMNLLDRRIDLWFFTDKAKEMAKVALSEARGSKPPAAQIVSRFENT